MRMTPWWSWTPAMAKSTRFVHQAARWLDRQPLPLVVAAGIVLGLGIGLSGFFYLRSPAWVVHGGTFIDPPAGLRSADRFGIGPEGWDGHIGFRCVCVPSQRIE